MANPIQLEELSTDNWIRLAEINHESFRFKWVANQIQKLGEQGSSKVLLDVGCGTQPFKNLILENGIEYLSQDFGKYEGDNTFFGLHNSEKPKDSIDFICDILEIPEKRQFDIVLCTEVFEHVPDPAKALEKLLKLVSTSGVLIVTVPGSSWTHQAPYYFSSGLSPYWFEHHSSKLDATVVNGVILGDLHWQVSQAMGALEAGSNKNLLRLIGKLYRKYLLKKGGSLSKNCPAFYAPVSQVLVCIRPKEKS
jgi:SAM-dependent methyltransferase